MPIQSRSLLEKPLSLRTETPSTLPYHYGGSELGGVEGFFRLFEQICRRHRKDRLVFMDKMCLDTDSALDDLHTTSQRFNLGVYSEPFFGTPSFNSPQNSFVLFLIGRYNLRLVQKQLGHASIRTTKVYADVMESDIQDALKKLYT